MTEERRRRGPGYHRIRAVPDGKTITFTMNGYAFETDWRDLWVTPPVTDRVDRIKVSRTGVSRSGHRGYPAQLFRSEEAMTEDTARSMALFWLSWKDTADAAAHPPVRLDHYRRGLELKARPALQEA